jgi:two-component system heavy metal sensor histidine kinase CusS
MSSKSAETPSTRQDGRSAQARWSITGRLALHYTLWALALLATATGFLYLAVTDSLELDDLYFLDAKVRSLRTILRHYSEYPLILEHEVQREGGLYDPEQHYMFFCRILDDSGGTVIETPGMDGAVPAEAFADPVPLHQHPRQMLAWKTADGRAYWLVSARGETGAGRPVLIQVALDDTAEEAVLDSYRLNSLAVLAVGSILFAGIGIGIARRGMRPLRNIARTAQGITPSRLHERIEPAQWPSEFTPLAEAFNQMLNRLEDSFQRLSQCAADLAHELRTPVHNLMGEAEVALSRERTASEYRQILESSLEEYSRLSRMINEILFLARAENPRSQVLRSGINVREELEAVLEFHEAVAESQGVSLRCQGDAVTLHANSLLLRRAVSNLVSNALRHTPRGGQVTLAVHATNDDSVVVTVADTGVGIPPEHLPKIFDRFYRLDRADSPTEGTGLGLAIVKSIVELHGGSVGVESTVGAGTTVFMRFPGAARATA